MRCSLPFTGKLAFAGMSRDETLTNIYPKPSQATKYFSDISFLLSCSLKPATLQSYRSAIKSFNDFQTCSSDSKFQSFPATTVSIAKYIIHLWKQGYRYSTIRTRLSALSYTYKINNLYDPTSSFLVKQLLKGAENQCKKPAQSLLPCLLYTSPSPRDKRQSRMPSSA